jgi:hypothetical protein
MVIPMLSSESLYIGVDIGKFNHVAGFISKTLLARHERFEGYPALLPGNGRSFLTFCSECRRKLKVAIGQSYFTMLPE